jgi:hypothetical protein
MNAASVAALVERQIEGIADRALVGRIRELLVPPYPVERDWDYGERGQTFTCWTILEHRPSNTGIAYCTDGFGPSDPWGLVFLCKRHMSIGMDSGWFKSPEGAMRESMAWDGPNPADYEVQ